MLKDPANASLAESSSNLATLEPQVTGQIFEAWKVRNTP